MRSGLLQLILTDINVRCDLAHLECSNGVSDDHLRTEIVAEPQRRISRVKAVCREEAKRRIGESFNLLVEHDAFQLHLAERLIT
jgi:hypothetical protein